MALKKQAISRSDLAISFQCSAPQDNVCTANYIKIDTCRIARVIVQRRYPSDHFSRRVLSFFYMTSLYMPMVVFGLP
jgi:hypothetical protein